MKSMTEAFALGDADGVQSRTLGAGETGTGATVEGSVEPSAAPAADDAIEPEQEGPHE